MSRHVHHFLEQQDGLLILYDFMLGLLGENDDSVNEMPYGSRRPWQNFQIVVDNRPVFLCQFNAL